LTIKVLIRRHLLSIISKINTLYLRPKRLSLTKLLRRIKITEGCMICSKNIKKSTGVKKRKAWAGKLVHRFSKTKLVRSASLLSPKTYHLVNSLI
jgi:hypothetical protein